MGPMDYVKLFFKNLVKFDGRSRRAEFWWPYLAFIVIYVVAQIIIGILAGALGDAGAMIGGLLSIVMMLFSLVMTLGFISAGIRRVHDHGKTGWFILIPIYNLILYATEGDKGPNEYGPDPKGGVATETFS